MALLLAVSSAVAATVAGGEGHRWNAPVAVANEPSQPLVGVSDDGQAVLVWAQVLGPRSAEVRFSARPAGGSWSAPRPLAGIHGGELRLAVAGNGDAAVGSNDELTGLTRASTRPASGDWGTASSLGRYESKGLGGPLLGIDANRGVLAVVDRARGPEGFERGRLFGIDGRVGGGWRAARPLTGARQNAQQPDLAVNPRGDAAVAWTRGDRRGVRLAGIQVSLRQAGGRWTTPVTISRAGGTPKVGVDAHGAPTVAWVQGRRRKLFLWSRSADPSGHWERPQRVGPISDAVNGAVLGIDATGDALACGSTADPSPAGRRVGRLDVVCAQRRGGQPWGRSRQVSPLGEYGANPVLAMNASGDAIVAWIGSRAAISAAVYQPSMGFGPTRSISPPRAMTPSVAIDAQGRALVAYQVPTTADTEGPSQLQVAAFE